MISKKDISYINVARYIATKSVANKRHGAVIVKGGRVVGTGYNKNRNSTRIVSPELIKTHCSWHAEELAIKDAGDNIKNSIIYIARINKKGQDRNSKPCSKCMLLIKTNKIKKIVYTLENSVHVSR
jgi:deoxycytidylate deaminase